MDELWRVTREICPRQAIRTGPLTATNHACACKSGGWRLARSHGCMASQPCRRRRRRGGGSCPAFASRPEGQPWNCGPPGGGQPRGGICESFPGMCRTAASGLHWWLCFFRRQLSKAGLSGYFHHLWLVPGPDSQPWQVPGRAGAKTGMTCRGPETASQKAGFYMKIATLIAVYRNITIQPEPPPDPVAP